VQTTKTPFSSFDKDHLINPGISRINLVCFYFIGICLVKDFLHKFFVRLLFVTIQLVSFDHQVHDESLQLVHHYYQAIYEERKITEHVNIFLSYLSTIENHSKRKINLIVLPINLILQESLGLTKKAERKIPKEGECG
jgi:hypothetical protein